MTPESKIWWKGCFVGALVVGVLMLWAGELRLRLGEGRMYQRTIAGTLVDEVVLAEALRLGVPDPLTRVGYGAQAVFNLSRNGLTDSKPQAAKGVTK